MVCLCLKGPASPIGTALLVIVVGLLLWPSSPPTLDEMWPQLDDGSAAPLKVIVTGSSSGIGEQLAYSYAQRGATVVLAARRKERLQAVVEECLQRGALSAHAVEADFSDATAGVKVIEEAIRFFGADQENGTASIDVLHINHAYMKSVDWVQDGAASAHDLRYMMQVSFMSFVDLATAALPFLEASPFGGRVIVSSSSAGLSGVHQLAPYSGAKHALHGFFSSLQQDLMWHNYSTTISLAVIGRIDTDGAKHQLGEQYQYLTSHPADEAAEALIHGGLLRRQVFAHPAEQIRNKEVFRFFAPKTHDAAVVLNSRSHPCTNSSEEMMLINCWGPIQQLLSHSESY